MRLKDTFRITASTDKSVMRVAQVINQNADALHELQELVLQQQRTIEEMRNEQGIKRQEEEDGG